MSVDSTNRPPASETAHSSPTAGALPAVLEGFDLSDQPRFADGFPYEVFARLRREAPVLFHPPGQTKDGEGFWVLSRHADICEAAASPAFSSQGGGGRPHGGTHIDDARPELPGVLINMMDDPRHADLKDVLSPAVGRQALVALEGALRPYVNELVDGLLARGEAEFAADVGAAVGARAISLLLGIPREDWPLFATWTSALMGFDDRETAEPSERSQKIHMDLFGYGARLLVARRAAPQEDLGSLLANAQLRRDSERPLTELERQTAFCLMVLAGTESTRNMIAGGVLALAQHPAQWQALRDERSLLPSAIDEILRWTTPTPYNRRTATRDVTLGDAHIRAGDKVTLWWTSANRDESVFKDPMAFDVRRDPNPHLAFGYGTHCCFGDQLGKLEMRLVLDAMLERVAPLELSGPVVWAASNKHTVVMDMPVAVRAR
ncbi:cytochrome P450 [Haliangium ochraceum]|uniref:Cytochrome P450 n=1 Tax=Haliangium ochraceum (strain DSM 14365 / JCM 11303 / SMP-2) TaxID=502025 RepID=D0LQX1_HALO1|nr:cytochrome P450 [Haliangium ochraceum]ACY15479.1 cytochrome P450 [Haliangium ochraceum DSM 14365]